MKKSIRILLFLGGLLVIFAATKPTPNFNELITKAFSTGNATQLSHYFGKSIDLTVSSNEGMYSKAQSEQILKKFFVKNPPKKFNILHTGSSKNATKYTIGSLLTNKGKFRVYLIYKQIKSNFQIQELSIQKDN